MAPKTPRAGAPRLDWFDSAVWM
jgi:hypothetical protein